MAEVCTQGVDTGFVALGYAKVAVLGVVQASLSCCRFRRPPICESCRHCWAGRIRLGIFRRHAARRIGRRGELLLERCQAALPWARSSALMRADFKNRHFRLALWIVLATIPIGSPAWRLRRC